jgi:hypothetical protein
VDDPDVVLTIALVYQVVLLAIGTAVLMARGSRSARNRRRAP